MTDSSIKLEVSKEAQDQVKGLIKSQKAGTAVRVFVQSGGGGGCGGGAESINGDGDGVAPGIMAASRAVGAAAGESGNAIGGGGG